MSQMLEIRWHARGGQGAKTAAILLAEAAAKAGKYIQGFPEYGPERMGAPMLAFNRISDEAIRVHCHVTNPRVVVILDPTLAGKVDVAEGVPDGGIILVNTSESPARMRSLLKLEGRPLQIYTVDASKIALETLGRDIPNTPMMGALMRVTKIMDYDYFLNLMKGELEHKFKSRPEVVEGNIKAISRAYEEVRGE
ncbi:MAG TPA: pyruvate synthase [Clostridia bacterium]|nr:pyruvate synthase [Clostridia bacterium]